MAVHGNRITAALKPLHENLEKRFKEMKSKTAPFKRVIQISSSQWVISKLPQASVSKQG